VAAVAPVPSGGSRAESGRKVRAGAVGEGAVGEMGQFGLILTSRLQNPEFRMGIFSKKIQGGV